MKNIYDTLEFNQIKNKISTYCVSSLGKTRIAELMPLKDTDDLKLEQKYLDQAMKLIFKYGKMPIGHFIDIEPLLLKTTKTVKIKASNEFIKTRTILDILPLLIIYFI